MAKMLVASDLKKFVDEVQPVITEAKKSGLSTDEKIKLYRSVFFHNFRLSDTVPSSLVNAFFRFAEKFYDKSSFGYDGIMEEIKDRVYLYSSIDGFVAVREFLKHGDGKTDIYDKKERICYEKKTGTGDWLRSERFDSFDDVIMEYRRKRTLIRWDYDFVPASEDMSGKKSVNKNLSEEEKAVKQERTKKTKKDGTKIVNKQYEIHIHIETSYKNLFDYMATYPAGLKTFFKESSRSGIAGVFCWELQTIKNSRKKIEFLQHFNTWTETGLTLAEYKAMKEEEEE